MIRGRSSFPPSSHPSPGASRRDVLRLAAAGAVAGVATPGTAAEPAGNNPPAVVFNEPVCTGLVCTVSSSGTTDTDGGIRNYTWQWGDGTPNTVTTSTSSRSHTYAVAGTYTITIVATDNWGQTSTLSHEVTVS